jgi:hypothetical protein
MIQHYGGPTRLLDFTWSPYVAAFFALETAISDAAVFAPDLRRLPETIDVDDRSYPSFRATGVFEDLFLNGTNEIVAQADSGILNPRLIAQLGTFVVPGVLDRPADVAIDDYCGSDALIKLTLERENCAMRQCDPCTTGMSTTRVFFRI